MRDLTITHERPEPRVPLAVFRLAVILVCLVLTLIPGPALVPLLVLLGLSLGTAAAYRFSSVAGPWPYAEAVATAAAVPFAGGGSSSLLPCLLSATVAVGLTRGAREVLLVAGMSSAVLLAGAVPAPGGAATYFIGTAEWVVLGLAVGLLPVWSRHLRAGAEPLDDYGQVRQLLEQLGSAAQHLPGSLDAISAAEALLDQCTRVASAESGAVIAHRGDGVFVPLTVRGVERVPWRTPLDSDGPLRGAWVSGHPALDARVVDVAGRRKGSAVMAVPLHSRQGPFALLVLESVATDAFDASVVERLTALCSRGAAQLETAMLFEEIRHEASNEARDRLAREMHDGIAQELAVLGYQLDMVVQTDDVGPALRRELCSIRSQVTRLMSELRLSITDLRTSLRTSQGLGIALSGYVQAVCMAGDIALQLSLSESTFRLPPDHETALLKAAQVFAQEVRRSVHPQLLVVNLVVEPPSASLTMSCDTPLYDLRLEEIAESVSAIGGQVTLSLGDAGEPSLKICLRSSEHDNAAAGRRPRSDPARAPEGLRAG